MNHPTRRNLLLTLFAGAAWLTTMPSAAQAPASDAALVPQAACAWIAVDDLNQTDQLLRQTSFGKLQEDPAFKPFLDSLTAAGASPLAALERTSGLSWEETLRLAHGETMAAVCRWDDGLTCSAMWVRTSPDAEATAQVLAAAHQRLVAGGAKLEEQQHAGAPVYVLNTQDGNQVVHALGDGFVLVANVRDAALRLLDYARDPQAEESLRGDSDFQLAQQMGAIEDDRTPCFRFFLRPIKLAVVIEDEEADDDTDIEEGFEEDESADEYAARHGFDAVRAVGGCGVLAQDGVDFSYRIGVVAPGPYSSTMKMIQFQQAAFPSAPDWTPTDAISVVTILMDLAEVVPNLGVLFDETVGDGMEGMFDDVLRDLRSPEGPQVDLHKDLFLNLASTIHMVKQELGEQEDADAVLIKVKNDRAVADAVKRLLRDDPTTERLTVAGEDFDFWRIGVASEEDSLEEEEEEETYVRFSSSGMIVSRGVLLIGTDSRAVERLLASPGGQQPWQNADDLTPLVAWLNKYAGEEGFLHVVSRMAKDLRATYSQLRAGNIDEAESIYAGGIRYLMAQTEDAEQQVQYELLPEYKAVTPYIGVAGIRGRLHPQGWVFDGSILSPAE